MKNTAGHFLMTCPSCGKVVAQCRCMGPKTERVATEPCAECKAKAERRAERKKVLR